MNQPRSHQHIEVRAVYTDDFVRVYQAFRDEIAEEAVRLGNFGPHFGLNRMTWIKPSFLWMMYRCGWAEKENQEHVLAIDLKRSGFDYAVQHAVQSSYYPESGITRAEWQAAVSASDVRIQWDPEKDLHGQNLPYRSIQLGLRGDAVRRYVSEWITAVADITPYVKDLNRRRQNGEDIAALLPQERPYPQG